MKTNVTLCTCDEIRCVTLCRRLSYYSWPCAIWDIHPKRILNSNFMKSRSSITSVLIVQSFWNFAQGTAVVLPCSVQKFLNLIWLFWTNEILQDLSFGQISHIAQGPMILYSCQWCQVWLRQYSLCNVCRVMVTVDWEMYLAQIYITNTLMLFYHVSIYWLVWIYVWYTYY